MAFDSVEAAVLVEVEPNCEHESGEYSGVVHSTLSHL